MRKRNKKKKDIHGFIVPAPFAGVIIILSSLAVGYLWLDSRCQTLGKELKALDMESQELNKKLKSEEYRWSLMKSPANLEKTLKRHHIVMSWPRSDQIVIVDRDMALMKELLAENKDGKNPAHAASEEKSRGAKTGRSIHVAAKTLGSPAIMKYAGPGKVVMNE